MVKVESKFRDRLVPLAKSRANSIYGEQQSIFRTNHLITRLRIYQEYYNQKRHSDTATVYGS
jgi:hypothetical protein